VATGAITSTTKSCWFDVFASLLYNQGFTISGARNRLEDAEAEATAKASALTPRGRSCGELLSIVEMLRTLSSTRVFGI
jgi:hypothetical protein